jgi:hypothetical protein
VAQQAANPPRASGDAPAGASVPVGTNEKLAELQAEIFRAQPGSPRAIELAQQLHAALKDSARVTKK